MIATLLSVVEVKRMKMVERGSIYGEDEEEFKYRFVSPYFSVCCRSHFVS
jgi:hypothetical protein